MNVAFCFFIFLWIWTDAPTPGPAAGVILRRHSAGGAQHGAGDSEFQRVSRGALSPLLAGLIAVNLSLGGAILIICTSAWALCVVFFAFTAYLIPHDIEMLRGQLRRRAEQERGVSLS